MTVASTASSTQQVHLTVERRSKSRYPLAWPCRHKNYNRIWLVETCLPLRAANSFIILLSWAVLFFSCRIHIYFLLLFVFVSIFISTYCGLSLVVLRVEEFVETSVTNIYISYRYLNLYLRLCLSHSLWLWLWLFTVWKHFYSLCTMLLNMQNASLFRCRYFSCVSSFFPWLWCHLVESTFTLLVLTKWVRNFKLLFLLCWVFCSVGRGSKNAIWMRWVLRSVKTTWREKKPGCSDGLLTFSIWMLMSEKLPFQSESRIF